MDAQHTEHGVHTQPSSTTSTPPMYDAAHAQFFAAGGQNPQATQFQAANSAYGVPYVDQAQMGADYNDYLRLLRQTFVDRLRALQRRYPCCAKMYENVDDAFHNALISRRPEDIDAFYKEATKATQRLARLESNRDLVIVNTAMCAILLTAGTMMMLMNTPTLLVTGGILASIGGVMGIVALATEAMHQVPKEHTAFRDALADTKSYMDPFVQQTAESGVNAEGGVPAFQQNAAPMR